MPLIMLNYLHKINVFIHILSQSTVTDSLPTVSTLPEAPPSSLYYYLFNCCGSSTSEFTERKNHFSSVYVQHCTRLALYALMIHLLGTISLYVVVNVVKTV